MENNPNGRSIAYLTSIGGKLKGYWYNDNNELRWQNKTGRTKKQNETLMK